MQFYLQDITHQKDHVILDYDQECQKIYFVVNGAVDLEIVTNDGETRVLETLEQGDIVGQYAVLYHTKSVYRLVAKTNMVRVLTLGDEFFVEYGEKESIPSLKDAIKLAEDFEKEWGLPTCDYKKFESNKLNMTMTSRQSLDLKFRIVRKRLVMLSYLNTYHKRVFEFQINCAMDKAMNLDELLKGFREREMKRKSKFQNNNVQNRIQEELKLLTPGTQQEASDDDDQCFGERHVHTDQLIVTSLVNRTDETDRHDQMFKMDLDA